MLLQADYSAAFRMDAVHRGRQVNESVMDDVAASMLGACDHALVLFVAVVMIAQVR